MNTLRLLALSIIALTLTLGAGACGRSEEKKSDTAAPSGSTPGSTKMSSSDLENAIKAKLNADEKLRSANLGVSADADKNEVTLSGSVPSQELRSKAVDLAKSAQSGVTVTDKIDVKPSA